MTKVQCTCGLFVKQSYMPQHLDTNIHTQMNSKNGFCKNLFIECHKQILQNENQYNTVKERERDMDDFSDEFYCLKNIQNHSTMLSMLNELHSDPHFGFIPYNVRPYQLTVIRLLDLLSRNELITFTFIYENLDFFTLPQTNAEMVHRRVMMYFEKPNPERQNTYTDFLEDVLLHKTEKLINDMVIRQTDNSSVYNPSMYNDDFIDVIISNQPEFTYILGDPLEYDLIIKADKISNEINHHIQSNFDNVWNK